MSGNTIVNDLALTKMVLHACRWSTNAINGVLLGRLCDNKDGGSQSQNIEIVDAVPLFHHQLSLAPMLTVALTQIEERFRGQDLQIIGYYQANENMKDVVPDFVAKKVTEKISENNDIACLIMIDNNKIGIQLDSAPIIVSHLTQDGKWKSKEKASVKVEASALKVISELMRQRVYHEINDFDLHLDDLKCDWANPQINNLLKTFAAA